ncbi:MAG: succinyl-CoA ligase subunit beta [Patescibacteria group bacterium]|nr:MAG: succinyl-CoA ligase subunit beta [Patescibacteria group bacterium]
MILKEFEGKQLLTQVGLQVPKSVLVAIQTADADVLAAQSLQFPVFVKAQVFHGNRKLEGLVLKANAFDDLSSVVKALFSKKDRFGQTISHVLVEEMAQFTQILYVSISYSTTTRTPVIQFSKQGGVGMDERGDKMSVLPISISKGIVEFPEYPELVPELKQLFEIFLKNDASLVEINPLVRTQAGFVCLDAKIELEDIASFRHPEWEQYGERSQIAKPPTAVERKAKEISRSDTKGVAGESFFEFPDGNIGVMASGGGASTLAMDALLAEGLRPANYTEYSGNPTKEKVHALTKLVLSLPRLEALYVVGSNANFTDIYDTLSGVVDGLVQADLPDGFKILIRRGGPRWQEAFDMVTERIEQKRQQSGRKIQLKLFGPDFSIVKTARELKKMFQEDQE